VSLVHVKLVGILCRRGQWFSVCSVWHCGRTVFSNRPTDDLTIQNMCPKCIWV